MQPEERHASLMIDEMQITPGLVYDHSCCNVMGAPTLPLADGSLPDDCLATHGLVFMLGGFSSRWKQTIGYHLTGNSFDANSLRSELINIITACESLGLKIHVLVSDMGGGNLALWRLFGIRAGKYSRPSTSCVHPCDQSRRLWFMPDVPHLLKSLRNHLTRGQAIYLPDDIVKMHQLPTNCVDLRYVKELIEHDEKSEIKLAPHLNSSCVEPNHYDKMKVKFAYSLFHNDTSAGLHMLVENGKISKDALTTAWFISTVFRWFRLMTSRTSKLAFSHSVQAAYGEAVKFLTEIVDLFSKISIGAPTNAPWKPIQTGITVATLTALDLQSTMLDKYNFSYFLLSRLSQDPLENLFSTLRSKNPIPRLYEFKCSLRSATLAQFLRPSKNASYSDDGAFMLLSLEDQPNNEGQEQVQLPDDLLDLTSEADQSIEYLAGYVVSKLLKRLHCENCRAALVSDKAPAKLISLKNFSESGLALVNPSPAVVEDLKVTENLFRSNREALIKNTVTAVELQAAVPRSISIVTCFPACHEIIKDIVGVYAKLRIHILVRNEASKIVPATNGKCASKSVGMHVAAANIR